MSARAAAIAYGMVAEICDRLEAAGVTEENAPSLDHALSMVWRCSKQLARLEQSAAAAGDSAARARAATLDAVTAALLAEAMPARQPAVSAAPSRKRWQEFDPQRWHVALVAAPEREHEGVA
jgi:hypothetical protein